MLNVIIIWLSTTIELFIRLLLVNRPNRCLLSMQALFFSKLIELLFLNLNRRLNFINLLHGRILSLRRYCNWKTFRGSWRSTLAYSWRQCRLNFFPFHTGSCSPTHIFYLHFRSCFLTSSFSSFNLALRNGLNIILYRCKMCLSFEWLLFL